jgi:hypothetical protein
MTMGLACIITIIIKHFRMVNELNGDMLRI